MAWLLGGCDERSLHCGGPSLRLLTVSVAPLLFRLRGTYRRHAERAETSFLASDTSSARRLARCPDFRYSVRSLMITAPRA